MKIWRRIPLRPRASHEIAQIAHQVLRGAGVGDRLPTQREEIIAYAQLIEGGHIPSIADPPAGFLTSSLALLRSAFRKIRGLLDYRERTIYVDATLHRNKKTFITYHEVGHKVIPWHQELFYTDDDFTLDPEIENELESEANAFAANLIFQVDRFKREIRDLALSIASAKYLADRYGSSYHSAVRQYVEDNELPCAALILKPLPHVLGENGCPLRLSYVLQSGAFTREFGEPNWPGRFPGDHAFAKILNPAGLDPVIEGEVSLSDLNGAYRRCRYQVWTNTYHIFVLVYPQMRRHLLRKEVVISNRNDSSGDGTQAIG